MDLLISLVKRMIMSQVLGEFWDRLPSEVLVSCRKARASHCNVKTEIYISRQKCGLLPELCLL